MARKNEQLPDVKFSSIAVLIDAENVDRQKIESILAKLGQLGTITTKRVYGDWSQEKLQAWKDVVSICALRTMHHFVHSKQKNTSDIALVIDAMDLLHTGNYDAFAIVSSDGDFSNLAVRIRNEDKVVIGVGQNKTNYNFVSICNIFINQDKLASSVDTANPMRLKNKVETLNSKMAEKDKTIKAQAAKMKEKNKAMSDLRKELSTVKKELRAATGGTKKLESQLAKLQKNNESLKKKVEVAKARLTAKTTKKFIDLLLNAISGEEIGENKYPLDIIGKKIREENPTFRPSDYGFPTLSKLLASTPGVKVTTEQNRVLFSMSNDLANLN